MYNALRILQENESGGHVYTTAGQGLTTRRFRLLQDAQAVRWYDSMDRLIDQFAAFEAQDELRTKQANQYVSVGRRGECLQRTSMKSR